MRLGVRLSGLRGRSLRPPESVAPLMREMSDPPLAPRRGGLYGALRRPCRATHEQAVEVGQGEPRALPHASLLRGRPVGERRTRPSRNHALLSPTQRHPWTGRRSRACRRLDQTALVRRFKSPRVGYSLFTSTRESQCQQMRTPASPRVGMRLSVGATWRRLPS